MAKDRQRAQFTYTRLQRRKDKFASNDFRGEYCYQVVKIATVIAVLTKRTNACW
jgi:hypothetical protein